MRGVKRVIVIGTTSACNVSNNVTPESKRPNVHEVFRTGCTNLRKPTPYAGIGPLVSFLTVEAKRRPRLDSDAILLNFPAVDSASELISSTLCLFLLIAAEAIAWS